MVALNPSAANIWMKCAANPRLSAEAPKLPQSDAATDGIVKHSVAALMLNSGITYSDRYQDVTEYVRWVKDTIVSDLEVECKKPFYTRNCYIDAMGIDANGRLVIADLKTGWREVDPVNNWQLVIYAYVAGKGIEGLKELSLVIFQQGQAKAWNVSWEKIKTLNFKVASQIQKCSSVSPVATPGHHCAMCNGKAICKSLKESAVNYYVACKEHSNELEDIHIAREYKQLLNAEKIINARLKAVEDIIEYKLNSGKAIPGIGVIHSKPKQVWKQGELPKEFIKGYNYLTPLQATKAGYDISEYVEFKSGKPKIKLKEEPKWEI